MYEGEYMIVMAVYEMNGLRTHRVVREMNQFDFRYNIFVFPLLQHDFQTRSPEVIYQCIYDQTITNAQH